VVEQAREKYQLSERQACRLLGQWRGTQRYTQIFRADEDALTRAIPALASAYGRYGYRRITVENGVVELFRNNLTNCELTSQVRKRHHSGVIASHSVDTSTWGSGSSTKVKIGTRCAIE
jgi:hypothetical protein